ncbi:MAG: ferredoxin [Microbacterium sp.]
MTAPATTQIELDIDRCMGAGQCVFAAPQHFDQDEETGLVILLRDSVTDDDRSSVVEAVRECPVQAIKLVDA